MHATRKNHDTVSIRDELLVSWVPKVQLVQAVQNVWNDLNYLNGWNSDEYRPISAGGGSASD
jgi:hypothetical protein